MIPLTPKTGVNGINANPLYAINRALKLYGNRKNPASCGIGERQNAKTQNT